jgi:hypothetical protein
VGSAGREARLHHLKALTGVDTWGVNLFDTHCACRIERRSLKALPLCSTVNLMDRSAAELANQSTGNRTAEN